MWKLCLSIQLNYMISKKKINSCKITDLAGFFSSVVYICEHSWCKNVKYLLVNTKILKNLHRLKPECKITAFNQSSVFKDDNTGSPTGLFDFMYAKLLMVMHQENDIFP